VIPSRTPDILQISGCPSDLDFGYFQDYFLPQLRANHPDDGFKLIERIDIIDQSSDPLAQDPQAITQSILGEKVIWIKFQNPTAKEKALWKLKDCLYRQEPCHDYIYILKQVNDGGKGEAERQKKRKELMALSGQQSENQSYQSIGTQ